MGEPDPRPDSKVSRFGTRDKACGLEERRRPYSLIVVRKANFTAEACPGLDLGRGERRESPGAEFKAQIPSNVNTYATYFCRIFSKFVNERIS